MYAHMMLRESFTVTQGNHRRALEHGGRLTRPEVGDVGGALLSSSTDSPSLSLFLLWHLPGERWHSCSLLFCNKLAWRRSNFDRNVVYGLLTLIVKTICIKNTECLVWRMALPSVALRVEYSGLSTVYKHNFMNIMCNSSRMDQVGENDGWTRERYRRGRERHYRRPPPVSFACIPVTRCPWGYCYDDSTASPVQQTTYRQDWLCTVRRRKRHFV